MEPAQRSQQIAFLAVFADVAAIAYLIVAVVSSQPPRSKRETAIAAAFAIYGLLRLGAAYGLRRLKRFGSVLERLSALVWFALAIYVLYRDHDAFNMLLLVPGIGVGIFALVFLGKPSTQAFFAGGGVPPDAAALVEWIAVAAVVSVVSMQFIHIGGVSRQKRTMADMSTIATAWEARATDFNRYNAAGVTFPTSGITTDNLVTCLTPTYVRTLPLHDGWGNNWQFGADQPWDSKDAAHAYAVISPGRDGRVQEQWSGGAINNFDCDIVFSNGEFIQYPLGAILH